MKLICSVMDELVLKENEYHAISFESSKIQQKFRQLLMDFFQNKKKNDSEFLKILDEQNNEMNYKDFYFIDFNCNSINLMSEKSTDKIIQDTLIYHLENHPDYIEEYSVFNSRMDEYINSIELSNNDLEIEFSLGNKTIQNFIKSLDINIEHHENEFVPNFLLRNFLIQLLVKMNVLEKRIFLIISFPESDIGHEDFQKVTKLLKDFKITTLVVTTQQNFLTAADIERIFLVKKYGTIYNISSLREELEVFNIFNIDEVEEMSKVIAFSDFIQNIQLLNDDLRGFLMSNKF